MRATLFMTRIIGMTIIMVALVLALFVTIDILREGQHARGFMMGRDVWESMRYLMDSVF